METKKTIAPSLQINTKKIGSILKSIDGAEYMYMRHCMGVRDALSQLIKTHNISQEDFCQRFNIKPSKYKDFVMGNYNYSIKDLACLNAVFIELETQSLKDKVPFKTNSN